MTGTAQGLKRYRFLACGQVQGVGFRPFVFVQAENCGLTGFVHNTSAGVEIEVQGTPQELAVFATALQHKLPPLAHLTSLLQEDIPLCDGERTFSIVTSAAGEGHNVLISPDSTICSDCLHDMHTANGRRYAYPFTNCTNCGPRFTITRSVPYDRPSTSMACFPLCPDCAQEYADPRNRRFHAQPNACPVCGPHIRYIPAASLPRTSSLCADPDLFSVKTDDERQRLSLQAADAFAQAILDGHIVACKGLGGFHLVCDATNRVSLNQLRLRKQRPDKPFAVMAGSLDMARMVADISHEEAVLLTSLAHPIVLCRINDFGRRYLAESVSPETDRIGIMLPYTPLHELLFMRYHDRWCEAHPGKEPCLVLVMTSGNRAGCPICLGNREAVATLGDIADGYLLHNRDILVRVDDSVVRHVEDQGTLVHRRARGYVPLPVAMPPLPHERAVILALGSHMKNTLCLTKGDAAFVSQHIGDMDVEETVAFHHEVAAHFIDFLQVRPDVVICDLHPDFFSADASRMYNVPVHALQHHFAHAHAVLAENLHTDPAIVLALDGTGYGEDGTIWGGEALWVHPAGVEQQRIGHLAPLMLPGMDVAIREPWRVAHALLWQIQLLDPLLPMLPWLPAYSAAAPLMTAMVSKKLNTPLCTSAGRLFDAVSAMLGLCFATTYEGQAAIRLEAAQQPEDGHFAAVYPSPLRASVHAAGCVELDTHSLFASLVGDLLQGTPVALIARRFHHSLAAGLVEMAAHCARERGVHHVGLSGGCLNNVTLSTLLIRGLKEQGLTPLLHRQLPPGDGCIAYGQAVWGRHLAGRR